MTALLEKVRSFLNAFSGYVKLQSNNASNCGETIRKNIANGYTVA